MRVGIIGAGPAGMMAAITAKERGHDVVIFEKNSTPGKKLDITGKGRCNITHSGDNEYFFNNVVSNPKFLMSSIYNFNNIDLIQFVNKLGVKTKEERGSRVFLASDNAHELTVALQNELKRLKIEVITNASIKEIKTKDNAVIGVVTSSGVFYCTDRVVIATGGVSYPATGSTGDGYYLAKELGHSIVDIKPALVPLILYEANECNMTEGLTLKNVSLKVRANEKVIDEKFGEAIFTSNGVSGPCVLSVSSKITKLNNLKELLDNKGITISFDLKPALSFEELYKRITRDFDKYKNKEFKNSLSDLLPKSLIPLVIKRSEISEKKQVNSITKEEKQKIVNILKNLQFCVKSLGNVHTGIVTSGGISTKEINPKTMESKIISGLFFAGEVIDTDAYTGGFNLQIAFSTGYLAGLNV